MRFVRALSLMTLSLAAAACGRERDAGSAHTSNPVDSVVPREVALARFQACCAKVESLSGGANSRDTLVARFAKAIATRDRTTLRDLLLTQAEFAWLYYPTTPQGLPPYDLSPQLMWFLTTGRTDKGIARALDEYGGKSLGYVGYRCDGQPSKEGENALWGACEVLTRRGRGDTAEARLFGQIIERGGRYKFVSYANKL